MLRINALGGLSIDRDGVLLAGAAAQPRRLAILAILARAGTRGVSRERVMALLWPESDDDRARRALAQALYSLRRDLGDDDAIAGTKDLRLDAERVTSDVGELEAAIADGDLERAGRSYPAPFLDGFHVAGVPEFERWVDAERAAIEHAWVAAAEQLALRTVARGDHAAAARIWRRLATIDPLNARVAQRLMRALAESGDRAGALRHARIYEALLHEELALPPDREVVALARQLRAEAESPVAAPASPAAASAPGPPPAPAPAPAPAHASVGAPVRAEAPAPVYAPPVARDHGDAAQPAEIATDHASKLPAPLPSEGGPARAPLRPSRWRESRTAAAVRGIRRSVVRGLVATTLLAIAAFAIAMRMRSAPARAQGVVAATAEPTIAIGTIADRTGGNGTAAALGDLLATNLARAPGLHVVSPARLLELSHDASGADSTAAATVLGAARRAGATTVIDGALYALPDGRLRLDLRRIELATGDIASARAITGRDVFALADSATAEMWKMLHGRE